MLAAGKIIPPLALGPAANSAIQEKKLANKIAEEMRTLFTSRPRKTAITKPNKDNARFSSTIFPAINFF